MKGAPHVPPCTRLARPSYTQGCLTASPGGSMIHIYPKKQTLRSQGRMECIQLPLARRFQMPLQEAPWSVCFPLTISLRITSTHWFTVSSETQKGSAPSCLPPSGSRVCGAEQMLRCAVNTRVSSAGEWSVHPPFVSHGHILSTRVTLACKASLCELGQDTHSGQANCKKSPLC